MLAWHPGRQPHDLRGRAARPSQMLALGLGLALLAAACTSGGRAAGTRPRPRAGARRGGSIVIGAEAWPDCLNPLTACSDLMWTSWTVLEHVLPRAMDLDARGNWVASPLLVAAPSLENGLLTANPFTVTYRINPRAVWDDGTPITSADFQFTWRAIMNTLDPRTGKPYLAWAGYDRIASVDTTDPHRAVIRFKELNVDWPDLFGGWSGFVLKRSAFGWADSQRPNLVRYMLDAIPFSGGPWKLASWSTTRAVLVPNVRYWGRHPYLDRVTFVPLANPGVGMDAISSGAVDVIYSESTSGGDILEQVTPPVEAASADGSFYEAPFFNLARAPVSDRAVREALMYAVDRQAILDTVVRANDPNAKVLNCAAFSFPIFGPWCDRPYFAEFRYQPELARRILEDDGYDCSRVPASPCVKNGVPLVVELASDASSQHRTTSAGLIQHSARQAGIDVRVRGFSPDELFGSVLQSGEYDVAEYALVGSIDPSVTPNFACDEIPTKQNPDGSNVSRWCNREADRLMKESDEELDPRKRVDFLHRLYALEVQDRVLLPLYAWPVVILWRTDRVAGPMRAFTWSPDGPFHNLADWYAA